MGFVFVKHVRANVLSFLWSSEYLLRVNCALMEGMGTHKGERGRSVRIQDGTRSTHNHA